MSNTIRRTPDALRQSELQLQAECVMWFWNTFPGERQMLHANDNNSYNSIEGARKKALGVVEGVSDFEFVHFSGVTFIECKLPGQKQSEKQKEFEAKVKLRGHEYILFYSFEEFKNIIYGRTLGDR